MTGTGSSMNDFEKLAVAHLICLLRDLDRAARLRGDDPENLDSLSHFLDASLAARNFADKIEPLVMGHSRWKSE